MVLVQIILIIPNNSESWNNSGTKITKMMYSKSLQSQRTKGEIKNSFNFAIILCRYLSKNGI